MIVLIKSMHKGFYKFVYSVVCILIINSSYSQPLIDTSNFNTCEQYLSLEIGGAPLVLYSVGWETRFNLNTQDGISLNTSISYTPKFILASLPSAGILRISYQRADQKKMNFYSICLLYSVRANINGFQYDPTVSNYNLPIANLSLRVGYRRNLKIGQNKLYLDANIFYSFLEHNNIGKSNDIYFHNRLGIGLGVSYKL